ncbi:MAG TPA: hypothetical protein VFZ99_02505 [Terriglobales bacterium]
MYRGTLIEELIESVERAEVYANFDHSFAFDATFGQRNIPTNLQMGFNQEFRVEVA